MCNIFYYFVILHHTDLEKNEPACIYTKTQNWKKKTKKKKPKHKILENDIDLAVVSSVNLSDKVKLIKASDEKFARKLAEQFDCGESILSKILKAEQKY